MKNHAVWPALVACALLAHGARAAEKGGMPDLIQVENTCLPTSTANVIIWFGKHGYPKLILPGATADESANHIVHQLMADTGARYDIGTQMEKVTGGIAKYIHHAGYDCDVEYRGLEGRNAPFTRDWLQQNDDPNKGFILLLTYCQYHPENDSFSDAWNSGHAVTLVNAEPDLLLIHDPAHQSSATGRKIVTPVALIRGTFRDQGVTLPVAGLMMLTGSLLEAPPQSRVMLTGAVCITMHSGSLGYPREQPALNSTLAGPGGVPGGAPAATTPPKLSWWTWLYNLFSK